MICDVLSKHVGAVKCFSVNNFRLIYDIQLVHLLVCNTQWIFKMHGATIKITLQLVPTLNMADDCHITQSKLTQLVMLLACIQEGPGSNFSQITRYPNWECHKFPQSLQANAKIACQMKPQPLPSTPFQLIIHYTSNHSMLCSFEPMLYSFEPLTK